LDGGTTEYGFDSGRLGEGSGLNLVSWKLDVNAHSEVGVEKRGFNGVFIRRGVRGKLIISHFDCTESSHQES
jgi:hypothetical protein